MKTARCINDGCGVEFDPNLPETRDPATLKAFWMRYCPKHRERGYHSPVIVEQR